MSSSMEPVAEPGARAGEPEASVAGTKQRIWPGDHVIDVDLRSMAFLRMAMSIILFLDTAVRSTDITAFYTDFGSLSRPALLELGWNQYWFSIHMATGHRNGIAVLLLIQALCAVGLLLGWRTRSMTFWSWLFLISIHSRNPMILNGGDIYLRVVLFWMLFLPWGQTWSLDARAGRSDTRWWTPPLTLDGKAVRSLAGLAVLIQISCVYWFAAIPKSDPSWTCTYTATGLALMLDCFITPFGMFFRNTFWGWLPVFTMLVIHWEFFGPFCFFFPFDRGQVRTLGVAGFVALHTGFGMCMRLGFFAWIGVSMPLVLLPAWFWERPARKLTAFMDKRWGTTWKEPAPYGEESAWRWFPREFVYYALILYTLLWNLGNENCTPRWRLPASTHWLAQVLRIDQRWNMFSPGPLTEDGWFVIEGRRRDGTTVDMLNGGDKVSWEKPPWIADTFKNERWRKYMMNLWMSDNSRYRLPFGQYLSRKFNQAGRGPRELTEFKIYYMKEITNPDGSEQPPEKVMIWHHWCFDSPPEEKNDSSNSGSPRQASPPTPVEPSPGSKPPTPSVLNNPGQRGSPSSAPRR
jgi:hypothetical protein